MNNNHVSNPLRIAVIDRSIEGFQRLVEAATAQGMQVLEVTHDEDGVEQLLNGLASYQDIDELHVFSHGAPGKWQLGATVIDPNTALAYQSAFQTLGESLSEEADLLIYGCDVGKGEQGQALMAQLASWTGADVAASSDPTGFEGDWELEQQLGNIEGHFDPLLLQNFATTLAMVDSTVHTYASNTWAWSQLAHDSTGKTYLIHKLDSQSIALKSWDGAAWQLEDTITTTDTGNTSFSDDLGITVDASDNLHIVYRPTDGTGIPSTRGIGYGYNDGNSWQFEWVENASDPSGWKNFDDPLIAVDASGHAHLLYEFADVNDPRQYLVKYATNKSGNWQSETLVSGTSATDETEAHELIIADNGDVYAFYQREDSQNSYGANLYYIVNSGSGWSAPQKIVDNVGDQKKYSHSSVVLGADGSIHVAYSFVTRDGNWDVTSSAVYYASNASGSWQSEQLFIGSGRYDDIPMLFSHKGTVYALRTSSSLDESENFQQLGKLNSATGEWTFGDQFSLSSVGGAGAQFYIDDVVVNNADEITFVIQDNDLRNVYSQTGDLADYFPSDLPVAAITLLNTPDETASSVVFEVLFDKSVSNVSTDDFALVLQGGVTAEIASVSGASGTSFQVTVNNIQGEGSLGLSLKSGTNILDGDGNTPEAATAQDPHDVDLVAPTVSDANIALSGASGVGGAFKIGDTVTASWNNTAGGDNNADVASVSVDFSQFGGGTAVAATNSSGTWVATYTLTAGSIDATNRNVVVKAVDNVGNTTTVADTTNALVDSVAPVVSDTNISLSGGTGVGGVFKIGDTVTATWDNTAGGDNNLDTISGVSVDFSQFGGGSAVAATNSSGVWGASYTVTAGAIDAANRNIAVTASDNAGNTTTTADTSNASVDNVAPIVTDANISLSGASGVGGAFKIGDTLTATWNNTAGGDNNSDTLSGVSVDFSAFGGGSAVAATNSSGTWTASYTLVAGAIDTTNLNIAVTALDNAGNSTTTIDSSNATADTVAPTVSDANISLSGASGTGGTFKIGDVVTATWDNTAVGDNNSDTVSGVTVDFSAFGGGSAVVATNSGGIWSASYTLTAGAIEASNRNVVVTAVDNAGNSTTTADTTNASVDNKAPSQPSGPQLATADDTGVSNSDGITRDFQPELVGVADPNSRVVVSSQLDGVLGSTVADASGNWSLTPPAALSEGSHLISIVMEDAVGNASIPSSATTLVVDSLAPVFKPNDSIPLENGLPVALDAQLTLAFSEIVHMAAGQLYLVEDGTDAVVASYSTSEIGTTLGGVGTDRLLLSLPAGLQPETRYRVDIEGSALTDVAGNALASQASALVFTTELPGALYTTSAGFDTTDGTGILDSLSAQLLTDDTIIITDHAHLAGAVLAGVGGQNRVLLNGTAQANFATADTISDIAEVKVVGNAGFEIRFDAAKGWQTLSTIEGNGATNLFVTSSDALDLSVKSLSGIRNIQVDGGLPSLTVSADQLAMLLANSGSLQGGGGTALFIEGSAVDTSGMVVSGFSSVNMSQAGDTTLEVDPLQFFLVSDFATLDTDGVDILRSGDAQLDLTGVSLNHWDTLENTQLGSATTTLNANQLGSGALTAIKHADIGGDDTLQIEGAVVDLVGMQLVNIDSLSVTTADSFLLADTSAISQVESLVGNGTASLQSAEQVFDVSSLVSISGFKTLLMTNDGPVTIKINDTAQFANYQAQAGYNNTLQTTASTLDVNTFVTEHINRFTTLNAAGTTFSGSAESEQFVGGDGNDILSGGGGQDELTGGEGADLFIAADGVKITDFSAEDTLRVLNGAGLTNAQLAFATGTLEIDTNADGDVGVVDPNDIISVELGSLSGSFNISTNGPHADITFVAATGGGNNGGGTPPPANNFVEDGASVNRDTVTLANGRVIDVTVVAAVSSGREEDPSSPNSALADVVLARDSDDEVGLRIGLPVGVGVRSEGAASRELKDEALSDLLERITVKTDQGTQTQQEMTSIGASFLAAFEQDVPVLVRTVMPYFEGSGSVAAPIVISGSSTSGRPEALVIDVSMLPRGSVIQLDNVDFAAIVGEARIIGGSGANTVVGDSSAQIIVLGEDDDVLYGGGGDDIVGSEGGDDRLFGGDGNDEVFGGAGMDLLHGGRDVDVASYTGNRDEYLVTQEHGVITVSLKGDPSDTDTLVNIEQLRFADGEEGVSYSGHLEWITGLYAQVLGRQGDVDGVQYWAQQHDAGLKRADMAMLFVNSLEAGEQLSVNNSDTGAMLDTLYQALLGREADTAGKAYWLSQMETGGTLRDVVEGFMAAEEMRSHDLTSTQWDFIA